MRDWLVQLRRHRRRGLLSNRICMRFELHRSSNGDGDRYCGQGGADQCGESELVRMEEDSGCQHDGDILDDGMKGEVMRRHATKDI